MEDTKKEQDKIPTGKIQRAANFASAGVKVGTNYLKYMGDKALNKKDAKEKLHERNADDLYKSLSKLKGSALKVAQILSMDNAVMPEAYTNKFAQAQYSAPPLSYPLVEKTFLNQLGKKPLELFEQFSTKALHAASIGQVHQASLKGKTYAVKVQYPGVAESIKSDLALVRPIASAMFSLNDSEINYYMAEVEEKLLEETDYELECKQATEMSEALTKAVPYLRFPKYYPEMSSKRILTMEWLDGVHFKDYLAQNPSQEERNRLGQVLWDFYDYQLHTLLKVHADPHPGNFLIMPNGDLGVLDFGCVKEIDNQFHDDYFALVNPEHLENDAEFRALLYRMNFIYEDEPKEDQEAYIALYKELLELLGRPFFQEYFNFGDMDYFREIATKGESMKDNTLLRKSKRSRGSRNALYINRSHFGLYNLLNKLNATVKIKNLN